MGFRRPFWPRYRGRRAGPPFQGRNLLRRNLISTIQPYRDSHKVFSSWVNDLTIRLIACELLQMLLLEGMDHYLPMFHRCICPMSCPWLPRLMKFATVSYANLDCVCITES